MAQEFSLIAVCVPLAPFSLLCLHLTPSPCVLCSPFRSLVCFIEGTSKARHTPHQPVKDCGSRAQLRIVRAPPLFSTHGAVFL